MPKVKGKDFPYTAKGKRDAKAYAKAKNVSYDYPSYDAGGRVKNEKYQYGGEVTRNFNNELFEPPIWGGEGLPPGEQYYEPPIGPGAQQPQPIRAPKRLRRYKKGGKVKKGLKK